MYEMNMYCRRCTDINDERCDTHLTVSLLSSNRFPAFHAIASGSSDRYAVHVHVDWISESLAVLAFWLSFSSPEQTRRNASTQRYIVHAVYCQHGICTPNSHIHCYMGVICVHILVYIYICNMDVRHEFGCKYKYLTWLLYRCVYGLGVLYGCQCGNPIWVCHIFWTTKCRWVYT